jgi:hypothetical protein
MNRALEPVASKMGDCVCEVDGDGSWLRRYPGPVSVFAEDLQSCDWLAEEESEGS